MESKMKVNLNYCRLKLPAVQDTKTGNLFCTASNSRFHYLLETFERNNLTEKLNEFSCQCAAALVAQSQTFKAARLMANSWKRAYPQCEAHD